MPQQGAQLRGKGKDADTVEPEERLLPETVTRQKENSPPLVVNGEGKHAVQAFQHALAPLPVALEQDLRVGMVGLKAVPPGLQFRAEIGVIVDLAVEYDREVPVRGRHRLGSAGQIHNGEATMAQMHPLFGKDGIPLGIRPTVGQRTGHSLKRLPVPDPAGSDESRDPAHQLTGRFLVPFTR